MGAAPQIRAWRPDVPGITEVLHAYFPQHAYPSHTHDAWTLLIVDDGMVRYDLDRRAHGAQRSEVTLLPPHVVHDGRSVTANGFRKRVVYLDGSVLGLDLIGAAVDHPATPDAVLRDRIARLHEALRAPGDEFEAASRLVLITDRLAGLLHGQEPGRSARDPGIARRLRELIDADVTAAVSLAEAADFLQAHPVHLVRAFRREYGIAPHRYLIGRRIDVARQALLAGAGVADAAAGSGFFDQSHLTRHFKRMLGITPGAYTRAAG